MQLNSARHIIKKADELVKRTGSRDPERIAAELGITIYPVPFTRQKGVYKVIERNRCIFIKQDLSSVMKNIVILHEIGHDQLHRSEANQFQEFNIFDMTNRRMEYEANLMAAHISLPDDTILEYIYQGYDAAQISKFMNSDINLVALKVSELIGRGIPLKPQEQQCDFLK